MGGGSDPGELFHSLGVTSALEPPRLVGVAPRGGCPPSDVLCLLSQCLLLFASAVPRLDVTGTISLKCIRRLSKGRDEELSP